MSIGVDISAFAKKTKGSLDETVRAIQLSLFSGVIRDTRVDTGRLRGNWQTNVGSPNTSTTDRLDPSGNAAISDAASDNVSGKVVYLTNNLPYARVWEVQDGMVARNMARIQRIVEEAGSRVRR